MKDCILRVDDRLIHGQVTAGWVQPLGIGRIVLVDDHVAQDKFEQEVYRSTVPPGIDLVVLAVAGAAAAVKQLDQRDSICIVGSMRDCRRLVEDGVQATAVNVGGIHAGPGRRELLPFLHLSEVEADDCRAIAKLGVKLEARMLPGSESYDVIGLLDRG